MGGDGRGQGYVGVCVCGGLGGRQISKSLQSRISLILFYFLFYFGWLNLSKIIVVCSQATTTTTNKKEEKEVC